MRAALKRDFLARAGWGGAAISPLAGDASNRRYERAAMGGRRAVLMDAPAERGEDIARFLAFTAWLRDLGLSAPEVFAAEADAGFALIEDLGDALFARAAAARPELEEELYAAAVDLLPRLASPPASVSWAGAPAPVEPYDHAVLEREAMLALDWWAKGAGAAPSADLAAEYAGLIRAACADVADARDHLALRDYHAENLIWLPERRGDARVGLLDYQDALAGHAAYDLVSLLEDARRDTSAALREAMIARHLRASDMDAEGFRAAYAALGAQRNLKIVGIFARLRLRDGKPQYLDLIPRVWAHLARDLAHPRLAPLADFVRRRIPAPDAAALARVKGAGR
ncbi:MAG: aminoglycoside phosphotransferase family protein [Pikeienuella sp.]